ncbi:MAG: GNAT family N-acetyltransferase [Candidatus Micrarchaeota archaeon]|nr:GNAT family N-acetyltransferase [Candidatus Micrarchaeota archaeon]
MRIAPISKKTYRKFMGREMKDFFMDFFGMKAGAEYYKTFSAKERAYFLSVREGSKTVGAVSLHTRGRVASIGAFAVAKGRRGSGVGTELLDKCEAIARKNKCVKIWLWTLHTINAYKFYKSRGYREEARLKKHWGGKDDLSVMSKFL